MNPNQPQDHEPAGSGDVAVPKYLWTYAQDHQDLLSAAHDAQRFLEELALSASIQIHTIEARAKSLESYRVKSLKTGADGVKKYSDPAAQIRDCVAARVIVYTTSARNRLADLIASQSTVYERLNPGNSNHNGYDSEHLIITEISDRGARSRYGSLTKFLEKYSGLEIQIRSVAAHAWAEYEHDIRYKSEAYEALSATSKSQINQWFVEAGGLRRFMDELFDRVESLLLSDEPSESNVLSASDTIQPEAEAEQVEDPTPLTTESLTALLRERFPDVDSGETQETEEILEHITRMGMTSVGLLQAALADLEAGQVARLMNYPRRTSSARHLDDELLAALRDEYVTAATDDGRQLMLSLRLLRLRGKVSIYSISHNGRLFAPVPGARAVRELAKIVCNLSGPESALVDGAISESESEMPRSSHARPVKSNLGTVFVATNLSRAAAEDLMRTLIGRIRGDDVRVMRAGDILFESRRTANQ